MTTKSEQSSITNLSQPNDLGASCSSSSPSGSSNTSTMSENQTNLIVNYLPQSMTQEDMRALFARVGKIVSCKLIRDRTSGQSLGYGFVNYANPADAQLAIRTMNRLKVSLARPSCESIKGANLYICGLPRSMTENDLEKLFQQCGKIITSRILYDSVTNQSKGVGFIRFDQRHEAELAIQQFNGYRVNGPHDNPLVVKFASLPTAVKPTSSYLSQTEQLEANNSNMAANLSTLLELKKLGFNNSSIGSSLSNTLLLQQPQADLLQLLTSSPALRYNPIVDVNTVSRSMLEQPLRRTGGPVHSSSNYRLRYNPIDGCAVSVPINPLEKDHQSTLTDSTLTNSLRLLPKLMELETHTLAANPTEQTPVLINSLIGNYHGINERLLCPSTLPTTLWPGVMESILANPCLSPAAIENLIQGSMISAQHSNMANLDFVTPCHTGSMTLADKNLEMLNMLSNPKWCHYLNGRDQNGNCAMENKSNGAIVRLGGLDQNMDEVTVRKLFSAFPGVCSVVINPTNEQRNSAKSDRITNSEAYVLMADVEQAKTATEYLNGCVVQNHRLEATWNPITQTQEQTWLSGAAQLRTNS